jgi:hypothetical protein
MKKYLDSFIYGLLYPGFVGSMIYELIPQKHIGLHEYFTLENQIKIAITFFYSLDYVHLYVDMNDAIKEENRNWKYLISDMLVSFSFFFAFVSVNLHNYELAIIFISSVPVWFLTYKLAYNMHMLFHLLYAIFSFIVGMLLLPRIIIFLNIKLFNINDIEENLLWFLLSSLSIYIVYLVSYRVCLKKKISDEKYFENLYKELVKGD